MEHCTNVQLWIKKRIVTGWFIYYSMKGGVCEVIQAVCPFQERKRFYLIH
jgi:hypothetical protein